MQEQMIKAYVNEVFDKYDTDKSGTLDENELTNFFNDLFKLLNINTVVTRQQSLEAIRSIDQNSDGNVDREELFLAFQKMLNSAPKQPITQSYPPPGYYPRTDSNLYTSYPPPPGNSPPQYPPGYNGNYQPPVYGQYGIENPYMKQAQYYPPPNQYQPQYQGYQQPYQPPYQPPYQAPYQGGYQQPPPPYGGYQNPYMGNYNPYMGGNQSGKWK